jgi:glycine oxidase
MLAPLGEAKRPGSFLDLAVASLRLYPSWLESLTEESGHDIRLSSGGTLRVALNEAESHAHLELLEWQRATGLPVDRLDRVAAHELEPHLSPDVQSALHSPEERQVDPERLLSALTAAIAHWGVTVIEETPVTGFEVERERVVSVKTPRGDHSCGSVVIATGAWSEEVGKLLRISVPVAPIRGQVVALKCGETMLRHAIYSTGGYLVPRGERVIVGATQEVAGFAAIPTADGVQYLLGVASSRVPGLKGAEFESAWAGLRPGTPDDLPILGRVESLPNVHLATGHFRNGILLAPVTGTLVGDSVLDRGGPPVASAFSPERFRPS